LACNGQRLVRLYSRKISDLGETTSKVAFDDFLGVQDSAASD